MYYKEGLLIMFRIGGSHIIRICMLYFSHNLVMKRYIIHVFLSEMLCFT